MGIGATLVAAQQQILFHLDTAHTTAAVSTLGLSTQDGAVSLSDDPAAIASIVALARDQAAVQVEVCRAHAPISGLMGT
ncbi:MAG TPA: hypothetical protein VFB96_20300 [Pirellulaceae bacterium]|nr:hypothetical protein [Pirellulaceae bacterium]